MKIIILGALGLIGNGISSVLSKSKNDEIIYSYSKIIHKNYFNIRNFNKKNFLYVNFFDKNSIESIFKLKPNIIINCVGITKHVVSVFNEKQIYEINRDIPILLENFCEINNCRLIHISTDCVFKGDKGNYSEIDKKDAIDIYGLSKAKGEELSNSLVLRTSTIGKEIDTRYGLLEWFLSQKEFCKGYANAIFSGITNIELGIIIKDIIKSDFYLQKGLFNISSTAINKLDLLKIINTHYKKNIKIEPDYELKINRSLNSKKFKNAFGYKHKSWTEMLDELYKYNKYE